MGELSFVKRNWCTASDIGGFFLFLVLALFGAGMVWGGFSDGGVIGILAGIICLFGTPLFAWMALESITGGERYTFTANKCRLERGGVTQKKREELDLGQVRHVGYLARKVLAADTIEHRVVVKGTADFVEVGPFADAAMAGEWARKASTFFHLPWKEDAVKSSSAFSQAPPEGSKLQYSYADGTGRIVMPLAGVRRFAVRLQVISAVSWVAFCLFGMKRMLVDKHATGFEQWLWLDGLVCMAAAAGFNAYCGCRSLTRPFLLKISARSIEVGPSEGLLMGHTFAWKLRPEDPLIVTAFVEGGCLRGHLKIQSGSKKTEFAPGYTKPELEWLKGAIEHHLQAPEVQGAALRPDSHSRVAVVFEDSGLVWKGFGLTLSEWLDVLDEKLAGAGSEVEEDGPLWGLFDINVAQLGETLQLLGALGDKKAESAHKALTEARPDQEWHTISRGVQVLQQVLDLIGSDAELREHIGDRLTDLLADIAAIVDLLQEAQVRGSRFRFRLLVGRPNEKVT